MKYYLGTTHTKTDLTRDDVIDLLISIDNIMLFTNPSDATSYAVQEKYNRLAKDQQNNSIAYLHEFVLVYELEGPAEKTLSTHKILLIVNGEKSYAYQLDHVNQFTFIHCIANIGAGKIFYSDNAADLAQQDNTITLGTNREPAPIIPLRPLFDIP